MTVLQRLLGKPFTWVIVGLFVIGGGIGMYLFQPWKLVTDRAVAEVAPTTGTTTPASPAPTAPADPPTAPAAPTPTAPEGPMPTAPVPAAGQRQGDPPTANAVLATGSFVTHEHRTRGDVRITALPDGRRILTIENLDTSNGPDLRVWLTDREVLPGRAGWFVFDDGEFLELGRLKGNKGTQNYDIPRGTDLAAYRSVTIWCKRFSVSFGAAGFTAT